ncbi:hypothetical protein CCH79_00004324 [Gambusia affinis]|uniref:Complement component C1q receptor n=1 Tax=Gambusia affinis TaxID=33528 RepID=A0A315V3F3_GAMAF|nr:hypothetical protein CCH79_00004324 [Gambusia affinis]
MLLIFLMPLISSLEGLPGAKREMLCTPQACFVLNMEPVDFHKAQNLCKDDGGYLMTLRDRKEEEDLRFKWVSGDEDSQYSNWEQEPLVTCTSERCVQVVYTFSDQDQLKWTQGVCRKEASYACKFYFQGMCPPLVLQGPGKIVYKSIFLKQPLKTELKLLPYGTRAEVFCGGHETTSSQCINLDGAYAWSPPGPFCKPETQNCQRNNGGCAQECRQDRGAVRCSCRDGWELEEDGFSCRMTDLCRPDTCEHSCVMDEAGVSCRCPSGFRLSENQRNCSDVDECLSQACDSGSCVNTPGSYSCVCGDGFHLTDGECTRVKDCDGLVCEHGCVNTGGSFSCFCQEGFRVSGDGLSCVDVDECAGDPCPRLLTCINTVGSFSCLKLETQETMTSSSSQQAVTSAATSAAPAEDRRTHRTAVELQHRSPHTDAPLPELVNVTDQLSNRSPVSAEDASARNRMLICVLGSVVPLLALVALTLFIAIFRCSRSKTEVKKKKSTADGYCWVSSGLDPRLEKLYESILTDDP